MRRVEACIESHGGYFEQLLCMYSSSYTSQIKCFRTHADMDIFFLLGMWNSCPKFVRIRQLRPVFKSMNNHPLNNDSFLSGLLQPV
jgi:hypothetical protein